MPAERQSPWAACCLLGCRRTFLGADQWPFGVRRNSGPLSRRRGGEHHQCHAAWSQGRRNLRLKGKLLEVLHQSRSTNT